MTSRILVSPGEQKDLRVASQWYEEQKFGLGGQFLDEVYHILARIDRAPPHFPEIEKDVRRALLHRFPFAV